MGQIRTPEPVQLFAGIISGEPQLLARTEELLSVHWGPVSLRSEVFAFDSTDYYSRDMGSPLLRLFVGFRELIAPQDLARLKRESNELECCLAGEQTRVPRPVNIDPGYLEQSKIVLASTKNFYHRILLADGIYGEVTMHYRAGRWCPFSWTFPDFRSGRYDTFFSELRQSYRSQLRLSES